MEYFLLFGNRLLVFLRYFFGEGNFTHYLIPTCLLLQLQSFTLLFLISSTTQKQQLQYFGS